MVDEPTNDEAAEQQEETTQDEGASPAGPVAGEGGSPGPSRSSATGAESQPGSGSSAPEPTGGGEPPSPAPPAGDESKEERPQDEAAEEAPAEEAPAEEKAEERAEKKKDVIPGADLEPISVEPEERPLSAEEQARREAEEEERREREAALASEEEEPRPASRAPAKIEGGSRYLATGKRKHSIARVTLLPGKGEFAVNGRPLESFFPRPLHQTMARQPLVTTGYEGSIDVRVRVHGGGVSGQAGAVRHGVARALTQIDSDLRLELKRRGYLTRDARVKERRKAGLKKARKRPQFSKR
jgi:small subunit ribosomal protein S9